MTAETALNELRETRNLSTRHLAVLHVSFEQFLRVCNLPAPTHERAIDALIKRETTRQHTHTHTHTHTHK